MAEPDSSFAPPGAITAVIDLSARVRLRFRGPDRIRFVNGQVSQDVRRLAADPDLILPACVCSLKGKLDAFVHLSATAGDGSDDVETGGAILADGPPELRDDDTLLQRFDRYLIADQVELDDVTEATALWHFLPGVDRPDLPGAVWKSATRFGIDGHDLWLAGDSAKKLSEAGAVTLVSPDDPAVESLRIRHGMPRWGAELGPDVLPAEAGLDRIAVDFHKGCYTGQEVVSRLQSVGRANRHLRSLATIEGDAPLPGDDLFPEIADDAGQGDKPVGQLTSVSPDGRLALGFIRRGYDAAKTRLVTGERSAKVERRTVLEIREV